MSNFIMAEANSRNITGEDKIFAINGKAKAMIEKVGKANVANATIGSLLDDNGELIVLSSVTDVLRSLSPKDYAEYAPIGGVPGYLECAKKAVFGTNPVPPHTEAIATPGGTGAIRNAIQNYTCRGDSVLTSDWFWSPYQTIAQELERTLETYELFDKDNHFNITGLEAKMNEILDRQGRIVLIINTPAHNPTGYALDCNDWKAVMTAIRKAAADPTKKIVLLVDIAYIDFSIDAKAERAFLAKLTDLPENVLPLLAYSMSKSLTLYGMRGGALLCIAPNQEIADEFRLVNCFSNRGSWSNGTRAAMIANEKIFTDEDLLTRVTMEQTHYSSMLVARGQAFSQAAREAGLEILPFRAGFFLIVPCADPDQLGDALQEKGIFAVPFGGRGLRVSIASLSEEKCRTIPAVIQQIKKEIEK